MTIDRAWRFGCRALLLAALAWGFVGCSDDDSAGGRGGSAIGAGGSGGSGGSTGPGGAGGAVGPGGAGGAGGSGGVGGMGGTGGVGGSGGIGPASLLDLRVGEAMLAEARVDDGLVTHPWLLDAGASLAPEIRAEIDGELTAVRIRLASADGALEIADAQVAVEEGVASLPIEDALLVDVPYLLELEPVDGALAWEGEPMEGLRFCFFVQDGLTTAGSDRFGPVVSAVAFGSAAAMGGAPFEVVAGIVDPAGVDDAVAHLTTREGFEPEIPVALAYDPATCLFRGEGRFSVHHPDGEWIPRRIVTTDDEGNGSVLRAEAFDSIHYLDGPIAFPFPSIIAAGHTPDLDPPQITDVAMTYADGTITIRAEAEEIGAGLARGRALVQTDIGVGVEVELSPANGGLEATVELEPWRPNATYFISQIEVEDGAGNRHGLDGSPGGFLVFMDCSFFCNEVPTDIPTPIFERNDAVSDGDAPVISGVQVLQTTVSSAFTRIEVVIDATDAGSGLESGGVEFQHDGCGGEGPIAYVGLTRSGGDEARGSLELRPGDPRGEWTLCNGAVRDHVGNETAFVVDGGVYAVDGVQTTMPVVRFSYDAPEVFEEAQLSSISLDPGALAHGVVELAIESTADAAAIRGIEARLAAGVGMGPDAYREVRPRLHQVEEVAGVVRWSARFSVPPGYAPGTWTLREVRFAYNDDEAVVYTDQEGFYSRRGLDWSQQLTDIPVPVLEIVDPDA